MSISMVVKIAWVKAEFGGRSSPPVVGLRPTIRFQRYVNEWIAAAWDGEITELEFDSDNWTGTTKLTLPKNFSLVVKGLEVGELIELLDGYRVIGVGKILSVMN